MTGVQFFEPQCRVATAVYHTDALSSVLPLYNFQFEHIHTLADAS